jgi:hypothetical protein
VKPGKKNSNMYTNKQNARTSKTFHDGNYEGALLNGRKHGNGVMRYSRGYVYEGEW